MGAVVVSTDPTVMQVLLLLLVVWLAAYSVYRFQRRTRPDPTPGHEALQAQQLGDARVKQLEHQALAEYHTAMSTMLTQRIERLS